MLAGIQQISSIFLRFFYRCVCMNEVGVCFSPLPDMRSAMQDVVQAQLAESYPASNSILSAKVFFFKLRT